MSRGKFEFLIEEDTEDIKTNQTVQSSKADSLININKKFQVLQQTLQSYEKRINKLEEKVSNPENKNETPNNKEKHSNLTKLEKTHEESIILFKEKLDCDSYIYLSVILSYNALIYVLRFMCCCSKNHPKLSFRQKCGKAIGVLFVPCLLIPGLATPCIQIYCFLNILDSAEKGFTSKDKINLIEIKIIILVIFLFMITKEASQAINSCFYCYLKAVDKKRYFLSLCFFPQIIQIAMTFFLLYVSILLIASTDDSISLIQNFAALYILLEIDTIIMQFIRLTKISYVLLNIDFLIESKVDIVKDNSEEANFGIDNSKKDISEKDLFLFEHDVIHDILSNDDIEADFIELLKKQKQQQDMKEKEKEQPDNNKIRKMEDLEKNTEKTVENPLITRYRHIFIVVRILLTIVLLAFGIAIWWFEVQNGATHHKSKHS